MNGVVAITCAHEESHQWPQHTLNGIVFSGATVLTQYHQKNRAALSLVQFICASSR